MPKNWSITAKQMLDECRGRHSQTFVDLATFIDAGPNPAVASAAITSAYPVAMSSRYSMSDASRILAA